MSNPFSMTNSARSCRPFACPCLSHLRQSEKSHQPMFVRSPEFEAVHSTESAGGSAVDQWQLATVATTLVTNNGGKQADQEPTIVNSPFTWAPWPLFLERLPFFWETITSEVCPGGFIQSSGGLAGLTVPDIPMDSDGFQWTSRIPTSQCGASLVMLGSLNHIK